MKSYINRPGAALSAVFFVFTLILSSGLTIFSSQSVNAAAPASITVNPYFNGDPAIECRLVMFNDTGYTINPSADFMVGSNKAPDLVNSIESNASLNADYQAIGDKSDPSRGADREQLIYIRFMAVIEGDSGRNQETCDNGGIFFSRPSDPTKFFGYLNTFSLLQPYFVPPLSGTTGQVVFPAGQRGIAYNITADSGSEGLLTNPVFSLGANPSVGFCSQYDVSGLESLRSNCMRAAFRDFNTITYRGETYKLRSWTGPGMYYDLTTTDVSARSALAANQPGSCKPYFRLNTNGNTSDSYDLNVDGDRNDGDQQDVFETLRAASGSASIAFQDYSLTCDELEEVDITVNDFGNIRQMFAYVRSANKITFEVNSPSSGEKTLITGDGTFTVDPADPRTFYGAADSDGCTAQGALPRITLDADPTTYTGAGPLSGTWFFPYTGDCDMEQSTISVRFVPADSTETIGTIGGATGVVVDGGTDEAAQEPDPTCSSEGGALGWILCPVLTLLDETTQFLESELREFLFIKQSQFDTDKPIYDAWSTFRSIATVIIVIVALMMIFSQAMGAGVFDNYSVKKLLPRLLIAGIGIQLSWFMLVQLINVFNILGDGIGGLIGSPFGITPETNLRNELGSITGGSSSGDFFTGLVLVTAAGFAVIGSIVPLALGVVAALFVGLITLIVRNMIVLLGVVLAPVAIAMSVLPGTQKTAKLWWESLEKALLMYPIVIALLMSGKIVGTLLFATAGPDANGDVKMVPVIAGIIAWYAPFFFLPKALQAGGSALSKITGLAGDKSKGIFDRANKWNDGRKDTVRKYKQSERNARLGESRKWYNPRKSLDKITSGQVGGIVPGGAMRKSTRLAREDLAAQGLQEKAGRKAREDYAERTEGGSLTIDQATVKAEQLNLAGARFDLAGAQKEIKAQEAKVAAQRADLELQDKLGITNYSNGEELRKIVDGSSVTIPNADLATRQAALNRLITIKDDGNVRTLLASTHDSATGVANLVGNTQIPGSTDTVANIIQNTALTGEWQGAFSDKAPDLGKGGILTDSGRTTLDTVVAPEKTTSWSADTWSAAISATGGDTSPYIQMLESNPAVSNSLDQKKRHAIERAVGMRIVGDDTPDERLLYAKPTKAP